MTERDANQPEGTDHANDPHEDVSGILRPDPARRAPDVAEPPVPAARAVEVERDANQLGCGHSIAAVVTEREGTSYCAECAEEARRCTCQWPITLVDKRTGRERCAECGRDVDNPERDANQLAADVPGLVAECRYRYRNSPSVPVLRLCDAADELVARITDLEAQVAALTQERDDMPSNQVEWMLVVKEQRDRAEAAEAALATARQALAIHQTAYAAVLAHAEGLRMDTPEDEAVRLKLVALLNEVAATDSDTA